MRSGPYGSESSPRRLRPRPARARATRARARTSSRSSISPGVAGRLDRVLVHGHVLRAGDGEEVDPAERDGLVDPVLARALGVFALQLLHPDAPAAGAAAERVVAVAGHLDELAADAPQHLARRLVDAVEAAERARVVVRDAVVRAACQGTIAPPSSSSSRSSEWWTTLVRRATGRRAPGTRS